MDPRTAHVSEPVGLPDAAGIAAALLDERGLFVSWNRAAELLVGYDAGGLLHLPAAELLVTEQSWSEMIALADQATAHGGWNGLVTVRHRDGHLLKLTVQLRLLHDVVGGRQWVVLAQAEQRGPGAELSQMIFEPLLEHSPVGVAVLDADLRYVWVNDWLEYGGAIPRERRLGRCVADVSPNAERIEPPMRRVLETGAPVLDFELQGPSHGDPNRRHAWRMSCFPLKDSAGRILGVWYFVMDVTDRWRARERGALLTEASAQIGSTLDIAQTAAELADVVVPRFADAVAVDLLKAIFRGEEPLPRAPGSSPTLRRAGQQLTSKGYSETTMAEVSDVLRCLPASLVARCLSEGSTWVESLADGPASDELAEDPGWAAKARDCGIHSILVTPVQARGVRLGVATFARSRYPDAFDEGDVSLAEELVARAAVCLDNARRFTRERRAALTLQQSLLPHGLAPDTVLDVASRYFPADAPHAVGGDWFDVIPLSGARVALVVGDVVGRGIHAAVTMGRLRAAVRTLADLDLPPDELLAHLDDLVISLAEEEGAFGAAEDEQQTVAASVLGATCLYAVYDPVTRRCTFARAGHLPPIIVAPDGSVNLPDLPAGPPLGLSFLPFESTELELPDGALLALFTDGLIEAGDRDIDVGLSRLTEALARPNAGPEDVCENVINALLSEPPCDDAALIVARTHGLDAGQVASWDLPSDPAFVATARDLVTRQLDDWGLTGLQFTIELIVSELVTNAIRYGRAPIRLRLIREKLLICEVSDASGTAPRLRHARTTDEGGRGLFLVAQLARRWGTRYTSTGKIIWAEQSFPDPAANGNPIPTSG
ncbi:SpoIIE family protein phosphatase [Streptomyces sp. S1D4-11]|nr:SpoIIE family protein phosphatase [Streptomyces sp. S1D4-11]QIZ01138.1 SpoIIE family protein phosphatase [Streptomyces sp. S1D4-11]